MGTKPLEQRQDYIKIVDHGFRETQIVDGEHYVLGGHTKLQPEILMPTGHGWKNSLPPYEQQWRGNLETMNCTNYGTLAIWETLIHFLYGVVVDWSERYTGVGTGTTRNGNNPHDVAEIIRTEIGLIDETYLPFDESIRTFDEYYSPKPMDEAFLKIGRKFLKEYDLGHEWVFKGGTLKEKQQKLVEALRYSPVGVSVIAWQRRNGMYFKEPGQSDNHWCVVYDFLEGKYWDVLDTYDGGFKRLEWDYDFGFAKWYSIKRIGEVTIDYSQTPAKKKSLWQRFLEWLFGDREYVVEK